MLNRGQFFRRAMASPRFKGCATVGVENVAVDPMPIPIFTAGELRKIACVESLRRHNMCLVS